MVAKPPSEAMADLNSIAAELRKLHSGLKLRHVFTSAVKAGQLLIKAKAQLAHGQWMPWLRENVPNLSDRSARVYMQIAASPLLKSADPANITIDHFLKLSTPPYIKVAFPSAPSANGHRSCRVQHADARKYPWPASARVIATDPPWDDPSAYRWLAGFAARTLVQGGLLLVQCGIGEIAERMADFRSLTYWWTLGIMYASTPRQPTNRPFYSSWRPILCFYQGTKPEGCEGTTDAYTVCAQPKRHHKWEQPLAPWRHWIDRLTPRGCVVLDPFCGSGTVGVACKLTGRSYLGTDNDRIAVASARRRITAGA
jgi:hypothetical protein